MLTQRHISRREGEPREMRAALRSAIIHSCWLLIDSVRTRRNLKCRHENSWVEGYYRGRQQAGTNGLRQMFKAMPTLTKVARQYFAEDRLFQKTHTTATV